MQTTRGSHHLSGVVGGQEVGGEVTVHLVRARTTIINRLTGPEHLSELGAAQLLHLEILGLRRYGISREGESLDPGSWESPGR